MIYYIFAGVAVSAHRANGIGALFGAASEAEEEMFALVQYLCGHAGMPFSKLEDYSLIILAEEYYDKYIDNY